jgi:alcohol dehydrogenase class IV
MALRNLKNTLIRLRKGLDLPENLQQAGIDPAILKANMDHLIKAALNDACCKTNPVNVEASMVRKVLEAVMGHG